MRKVPESIPINISTGDSPSAIQRSLSALLRQLTVYASLVGYRLNRAFPYDGSEPMTGDIELSDDGPIISTGSGSPEGSKTAPVGSVFHRTDGGGGTSFYVKETGTGNTGWIGK